MPTAWVEFDAQKTTVITGFPLLAFRFSITEDNAYLSFGMQPGKDPCFRRRVYDTVKEHGELFNDTGTSFVAGWVTFHSTGLVLDEVDYDNWDKPETQVKIREWLARFAEHHVKDMSEVIEECLRDYQPK